MSLLMIALLPIDLTVPPLVDTPEVFPVIVQ
jgi:hypothetical protein